MTSLPQYAEWERLQAEWLAQEEELAALEAECDMYRQTNGELTERNSALQRQLREVEAAMAEKRQRILELEEKLRTIEMERKLLEKTRLEREAELSDLQNQLGGAPDGWANRVSLVKVNNVRASLNSERRDFLTRLSDLEWVESRTSQSINTQEIHDSIKKEYDDRLEQELEKMKLLYQQQLSEVKLSIEKVYGRKIAELTSTRDDWSRAAKVEVEEILARLEAAKLRIIELERQKLDLSQEERRLQEKLEEDEASYQAQIAAKRKEVEYLKAEHDSLSVEYARFEQERAEHGREVARYSELIKPAEERVTKHAQQFQEPGAPADSSSSSSSSSSSDEETELGRI